MNMVKESNLDGSNELTITKQSIKNGDPNYWWLNMEIKGIRVGKARIKCIQNRIIIKSILIYPEFQKLGFASKIIEYFKETASEIIADRVRSSAKKFWKHMGFSDTGEGKYKWFSQGSS